MKRTHRSLQVRNLATSRAILRFRYDERQVWSVRIDPQGSISVLDIHGPDRPMEVVAQAIHAGVRYSAPPVVLANSPAGLVARFEAPGGQFRFVVDREPGTDVSSHGFTNFTGGPAVFEVGFIGTPLRAHVIVMPEDTERLSIGGAFDVMATSQGITTPHFTVGASVQRIDLVGGSTSALTLVPATSSLQPIPLTPSVSAARGGRL